MQTYIYTEFNVECTPSHQGIEALCQRVFRSLATLRCLPVNVLCRHLDVARLAVDAAVLR